MSIVIYIGKAQQSKIYNKNTLDKHLFKNFQSE